MYKLLKTQLESVRQTLDRLEAVFDFCAGEPGFRYKEGPGDHVASAQLGSIQQKLGTLLLREDMGYHVAESPKPKTN